MPVHQIPISRRQFMRRSALLGGGLLFGKALAAAPEKVDPNRWALMADTHIHADPRYIKHDINMADHFAQVAREIAALEEAPAGMLVAGDCVYIEGRAKDYTTLVKLAEAYEKAEIPVHWVLGNHDNRENFLEAFPQQQSKQDVAFSRHCAVLEAPQANWILLDSLQKTNQTPGLLDKDQLAWLERVLDAQPDKPALLVSHHYPSKAPCSFGENGLEDTAALMEVVVKRKQVKAWVFGHSHRWAHQEYEGMHLVNLPAVAWLFDESQPRGWVDVALKEGGASFALNALDKNHPKHGECLALSWRKG